MSSQIKQAVLLAAGIGSRLRPITDSIPKCLVPINGKPLLYIWLEDLAEVGVERFLINTHYMSHKVEDAILAHPLSKQVKLIYEEQLKGTAGTVRALLNSGECLSEDTLVAHADNLCVCDWRAFFQSHMNREKSCIGTLMSFRTDSPQSCGILEIDEHSRLIGFHEKVDNPPGNLANAAVYIFSEEVFRYFESANNECTDISYHVIPQMLDQLQVWQNRIYLRDIGNPESYRIAQREYADIRSNRLKASN